MRRGLLLAAALTFGGCGTPVLVAPLRYADAPLAPADAPRDPPPAVAAIVEVDDPPPRETTLANGLHVVFVPRHEARTVALRLVIDRGAIDLGEHGEIAGEQAAFVLARGRMGTRAARKASALGGTLTVERRSSASEVALKVSTSELSNALALLAELFVHTDLSADEYAALVPVWRSQTLRTRALDVIAERAMLFGVANPYGSAEWGKELLGREELLATYARLYVPAQATLVVVGNLSPETLDATVAQSFGGWEARSPLPRDATLPPPSAGPRVALVGVGMTQTFGAVCVRGPLPSSDEMDAFALAAALLGSPSSKLFAELRERQGAAYTPGGTVYANRSASWLAVAAMYEPYKVVDGLKTVVDAMRALRSGHVTDAEIATAREILLGEWRGRMATVDGTAHAYAEAIVAGRSVSHISSYPERVKRLMKDDVARLAARYFSDSDLRVVLLGRNQGLNVGPLGLGQLGGLELGLE
jgi:zinc protease